MRRLPALIVICGVLAIAAVALRARAQDGPPGGPGGDRGGPPPQDGPGPDGPGGPGGPGGGFHLLPPFAVEQLNLTEAQRKQLAGLEKETKAKLDKILTPKQRKMLAATRPPREGQGGPGQGGPGGRRGPGGPGGGPGGQAVPADQTPARAVVPMVLAAIRTTTGRPRRGDPIPDSE